MASQSHPHSLFLLFSVFFFPLVTAQSHPHIDASDLNALFEIRNRLTGEQFFSTWDFTSPDPCSTFAGVTCDGLGRVTALSLGSGLGGSLWAWAGLPHLTQLILFPGVVVGPIPPEVGLLSSLQLLSLSGNALSGPIPLSLSLLPSLHTLDLSRNRLSGSVPPALPLLPSLKVLVLSHNSLSGRFPGWPASLLHVDFKMNRFTGPLPGPLPPSLRYLSASNNLLWGPLNGLLRTTEQLAYLDLSMNLFSGPIPSQLFRPSLSTLLLQRNNLSGEVPHSLSSPSGSYGEGSIVDLSHNRLTGDLPPVLADVETLFLNNNRLTGKVPVEYADSVRRGTTTTLYLQHNYISDFTWDSGVDLPDTASLCLSYNCMEPPPAVGLTQCPASAGGRVSRPSSQCGVRS